MTLILKTRLYYILVGMSVGRPMEREDKRNNILLRNDEEGACVEDR